MTFSSHCQHTHRRLPARVMQFTTAHGQVTTPAFMPVGTRAAVNHMSPQELSGAGSQIILGGNTYHMLVSPGMAVIEAAGGMHEFMQWHGPMLTDSGGFQVFSLSKNSEICTIDEQGAQFKHPQTQQIIRMTPTVSIQTQKIIGADIIMAFDECTPEQGGRQAAEAALARTDRWLQESLETHHGQLNTPYGHSQALFGIIQGGSFRDLREQSAQTIVDSGVNGIAIGGEVIGFDMQKTAEVMSWLRPILPRDKIRYTMGVGLNPQDLITAVSAGVDIFDCVAPTRNARHGALYHGIAVPDGDWVRYDIQDNQERILIKKRCYAQDERPILEGCQCYTCQHYTRAQLHAYYKTNTTLYSNLACIHNIHAMHQTCEVMRQQIMAAS